ncbi:MAG: PfkB family carbohydrate kinase [Thermoanaerobaculia bacterium]
MPPAAIPPPAERLLALVDALPGRRVVVLADLVLDAFITGTPKRISREAPVLILRFEERTVTPGGGANAVANVAALDGEPIPLGVVGDEAEGAALRDLLAGRGVDVAGLITKTGYRTPVKTRILGGGPIKQQIVRYDVEDTVELGEPEREAFGSALAGRGAPVAILSDYGYGSAVPELVPWLRDALGPDALLVCDSRYRLERFAGIDAATPNLEETETLAGRRLAEDTALLAEGPRLRERLGCRHLLVTRGSRGMALFTEEGVATMPVHGTDEVADVTGAGDTVIGTFALALAAGATALEAALLADYAGGVVVMKRGTATLDRTELAEAVRADPRPREELTWARS